jgi:SAM-dependent methyltransferase
MRWTTKARIQALLGALPEALGNPLYYALQKLSGSFREPRNELFQNVALDFHQKLLALGQGIGGKSILEVGTGRRVTLPVCLWLMGAERVYTVDLHRYVRDSLVCRDLDALVRDQAFLGRREIVRERADALRALVGRRGSRRELFELCHIEYLAPADAAALPLPDRSIDLHLSFTVLEHIPAPVLTGIFREAARLLRPGGLAVHVIDHSDHFAHADQSLSPVHFLKFDDESWARLADNRYMYMNRLRADDYGALYRAAGHEIVYREDIRDESLRESLAQITRLAERFAKKSEDALITMTTWVVSRPQS